MKVAKKLCLAILISLGVCALFGCGSAVTSEQLPGVYVYQGESFSGMEGDDFTITLEADGSYSFYESMLSSYIGTGSWQLENGVLTLTEDENIGYNMTNRFRVDGKTLRFVEKDSDNFIYLKLADGAKFCRAKA